MKVCYHLPATTSKSAKVIRSMRYAGAGVKLIRARTVTDLDDLLVASECSGFLHMIGVTPGSPDEIAQLATRVPQKLAFVAGDVAETSAFLADIAEPTRWLFVALEGFERLGAQMAAARLRCAPHALFEQIMRHAFPRLKKMSRLERECLETLFLDYPFHPPPKGFVVASRAHRERTDQLLGDVGIGDAACVRRGLFAIAVLTWVNELGVSVSDAVRYCGFRDLASARRRVCEGVGVAEFSEARALTIVDYVDRAFRGMLVDADLQLPLARVAVPLNVHALNAIREIRRSTSSSSDESSAERDALFGKVWSQLEPSVRQVLPRSVSWDDAEEAVCLTRELFWRKFAGHCAASGTGEWELRTPLPQLHALARKIATSKMLDILRKSARSSKREVRLTDDTETHIDSGDPRAVPEQEIESDRALDIVRQGLRELRGRSRKVIELRLAGRSLAEIAAVFGVTLDEAKDAHSRAVRLLKDIIGRPEEGGWSL